MKLTWQGWRLIVAAALAAIAAPAVAAPQQIVAAAGRWAALRGGGQCSAESLALLPPTRTRGQGRIGIAFDAAAAPGRRARHGELAVLLSRPARPGASVVLTIGTQPFLLVARGQMAWSRGATQEQAIIEALRSASGLRVETRAMNGARFVDRYEASGAPTAIDAAAACAATALVKSPARD